MNSIVAQEARLKTFFDRLLEISSLPLGPTPTKGPNQLLDSTDQRKRELGNLLLRKNGFLAFESALHVFPLGPVQGGYDLDTWNSDALWHAEYMDMTEGYFFFAQDLFGEQFCIKDEYIWRFNPETGEGHPIAPNIEAWCQLILDDFESETGYPLAHAWQVKHAPLPLGKRLIPKQPFVIGGMFELDNLYLSDAAHAMRLRANLARQIRDLPDGAEIDYVVTE
jgi:hypothetical protein